MNMNENSKLPSSTIRCALFFTALFALLAHGYRYLSLSFSGDSMLLAQVGEEAYQTSLGRFLQPVYWQIRGYITAPFLIGLFATGFLFLSALLVIRLLGIQKPLHIALVCGILGANETMALSNATYLPWTDVYMLALLLCLLGVYAFMHMRFGLLISAVLYSLSLGLYQSYLPSAATMLILLFLLEVLDGKPLSGVWRRGLLACVSLVLGLLLYALTLKIVLALTGGQASQDYNGVGRVGLFAVSEVPKLLTDTFIRPLQLLFSPSGRTVLPWHVPVIHYSLNIALFSLTGLLLVIRMKKRPVAAPASERLHNTKPVCTRSTDIGAVSYTAKKRTLGSLATVLFLLLMLPLGMNFVQFISHGIASGLTIYAFNLLYLLPVALVARSGGTARISRIFSGGVYVLLAVFLALNIRASNTMSLKRDLEFSSTTAAMSRLLDQAEQAEGYVPGETPVVLVGMLPTSMISMERPGFEEIARVQGMRYTYGASYETANYWYLQMALGEPINLVPHEERVQLTLHPEAAALPRFPQAGCCRMIDGYLFVRIN